MVRIASLIAGLALVAGAAQAQDYQVPLSGKSPAVVQAEINVAAAKACNDVYTSNLDPVFDYHACVKETVAATRAELPAGYSASATDLITLAQSR